jgi:hypothetical protein
VLTCLIAKLADIDLQHSYLESAQLDAEFGQAHVEVAAR